MALSERIGSDLTTALKSGDFFARDTLRFLKSVINNKAIDSPQELTDEQIIDIIHREVKKRAEAEKIYQDAGKLDLAANEAAEAELLKRYLPEPLDEKAVQAIVADYLNANPTEIGQLGQAMGELSAKLKGRADLGLVVQILRQQIPNSQ